VLSSLGRGYDRSSLPAKNSKPNFLKPSKNRSREEITKPQLNLEYRLSWVYTVVKTAPMIGLLGTVLGMMKAFAKLADPNAQVVVSKLAMDIQFALITTALGLAIAIPLVLCTAYINVVILKMENLVSYGVKQFFEIFKNATRTTVNSTSRR